MATFEFNPIADLLHLNLYAHFPYSVCNGVIKLFF